MSAGKKLEAATNLGDAFTGTEAVGGRRSAVWQVARFVETMDVEEFEDAYSQHVDPHDNHADYVENFKATVSQLTDLIALGKVVA